MKTQKINKATITILVIFSLITIITKVNAETIVDTTTATGISNTLNSGPASNVPAIRERIRADIDTKVQNMRNNQDTKNQMIENGYRISTTTARPPLSQKNIKLEKLSSSSPILNQKLRNEKLENMKENRIGDDMQGRMEERREDRMEGRKENRENSRIMALEKLKEKRDSLGKNLEVALKNLVELRKRIATRIDKDRNSGKDMTRASELLVIADAKIATAKQAVDAVKSYKPENFVQNTTTESNCATNSDRSNSSNTSSSTSKCLPIDRPVDLEAIRSLVNKAQSSIKDVHKALNDVVVAIAKILGNNQKSKTSTTTPVSTITPEAVLPSTN